MSRNLPAQCPSPSGTGRLYLGLPAPCPNPNSCRYLRHPWSAFPPPLAQDHWTRQTWERTSRLSSCQDRGSSLFVSLLTEQGCKPPGPLSAFLPAQAAAWVPTVAQKRAGHLANALDAKSPWNAEQRQRLCPGAPTGPQEELCRLRPATGHVGMRPLASPWIWSRIPRSLLSTSRRFSRSCRPMSVRLRSSRRNSAEAFTSSTPWLAGRGERC